MEIAGAPVLLRKSCLHRQIAAQAALVERHPGDHPNVHLTASWEELVFRSLVEDVVDDLYGVNQTRADGLDSVFRLPTVQAESKRRDEAVALELGRRILEFLFIGPTIVPDMQLQKVDAIDAEPPANEVRVMKYMFSRKHFIVAIFGRGRPTPIERRNLRRHVKPFARVAGHDRSGELIALAFAVGPGGVEEIAVQIHRGLHGAVRFLVVGTGPAAHAPQAISDFADGKAGAAQLSKFHSFLPCFSATLTVISSSRTSIW